MNVKKAEIDLSLSNILTFVLIVVLIIMIYIVVTGAFKFAK